MPLETPQLPQIAAPISLQKETRKMSDQIPDRTIEHRAETILSVVRHQFGELFIFAHNAQELAECIEVCPEIGNWMRSTAKHSGNVAHLWGKTQAILDSRAAARAIDKTGI